MPRFSAGTIASPVCSLVMTKGHSHDQIALVLQGGGALGSYQAGAYEALAGAAMVPQWLAGISIGSINSAIIAGNPPDQRVAKLRDFWQTITNRLPELFPTRTNTLSEHIRALTATWSSLVMGAPHFFKPRLVPPFFQAPGAEGATSFYDSSALHQTLLEFVDFDRLNDGDIRVSLGAVQVETGNFAFFDTSDMRIEAEHVMASGALPPGLPAVEVDGTLYWDGGLVSNTPLSYVMNRSRRDTLIFQVDLFPARGHLPQTMVEVEERRKDIVYSSRTRMNTDAFRTRHVLKSTLRRVLDALPEDVRASAEFKEAEELAEWNAISVVQLIYRHQGWGGASKDFEFSRGSMLQHWEAGRADAATTLASDEWRTPPPPEEAIAVYDLSDPAHQERRAGTQKLEC
ncbi:patatin-like phospholipase family protein [Pacificimonas sp. ICDLI1SI03]